MKAFLVAMLGAALCATGGALNGTVSVLLCFIGGALVACGVSIAQESRR